MEDGREAIEEDLIQQDQLIVVGEPMFGVPAGGDIAGTTQDPMAKFLKPAGIAAAGIAGVGALVGVVWLFDKVKGFFNRKRNDDQVKESRKRRRHVRDWTVSN